MQQSEESLNQPSDSKSQNSSKTSPDTSNQRQKERPRSWSTESDASSSENEMDTGDKHTKNKLATGELDFQAELEKTKMLIVRSKSKENTGCAMEEGMKEGKSLESLPDNKENMEDSGMNDLLEEESNVVDIPLGDE